MDSLILFSFTYFSVIKLGVPNWLYFIGNGEPWKFFEQGYNVIKAMILENYSENDQYFI